MTESEAWLYIAGVLERASIPHGICIEIGTACCQKIISEETLRSMDRRIIAYKWKHQIMRAYIYPVDLENVPRRVALCKQFAEDCIIEILAGS